MRIETNNYYNFFTVINQVARGRINLSMEVVGDLSFLLEKELEIISEDLDENLLLLSYDLKKDDLIELIVKCYFECNFVFDIIVLIAENLDKEIIFKRYLTDNEFVIVLLEKNLTIIDEIKIEFKVL